MMSKNRYRYFVDPASWFKDSEEPTDTHTSLHARATKRECNQVTAVERLPEGCVVIHVEFKRAKGAGSP